MPSCVLTRHASFVAAKARCVILGKLINGEADKRVFKEIEMAVKGLGKNDGGIYHMVRREFVAFDVVGCMCMLAP